MTENIAGLRLTRDQEILLGHTGTVEQVLAIIAGSPIEVKVTRQQGTEVIEREAVLLAKGRVLVRARSKIYCKNLPAGIVRQVRQKRKGIGAIIASSRLETFREVVRVGRNPDGSPYRIYRIMHGGKAAFEIREDLRV
ncbi:MAG: chorismate--pyruvate lyase family protein [Nitrososphaera sp.]|uniref:chorismate--pyruvate lyase family protein n=1 Tax=Nitrososphaera sp. TaxID=1971748 RepID=UPI003D6E40E6